MKSLSLKRKIEKKVFEQLIGKIFYEERKDRLKKINFMRGAIRSFNQRLNENSIITPWIYKKEEYLDLWRTMTNDSKSTACTAQALANKLNAETINVFLHNFWSPQVQKSDSLLEIGANCGVNLYHLNRLGYHNIAGVEISSLAIEQMRQSFPGLDQRAKIYLGSAEEILPTIPSSSYDVVFTMGAAMHIHPASNFIFGEMARIARKYICSLEPEVANSNFVFARNYRRVYEHYGCSQLKSVLITKESYPECATEYSGCVTRLFVVLK